MRMRTTLTLDDDLAQTLKELAAKRGTSFRSIVNETLRRGLARPVGTSARKRRFRVHPIRSAWRSGVDPEKLNQLLDDLDAGT